MASLRELQDKCATKGLKYKGKTKAQLMDALKLTDSVETNDVLHSMKTVKELREICSQKGLYKVTTKAELVKRLESLENQDP